ncbi:hypothetical protein J2W96_007601 [Variovorax guangxiensis]|nr:hypothetical protein [Variovorax guangxiensis]
MKRAVKLLLLVVVVSLVSCGAPKPPGWPTGEERPINPSRTSKVPK